jgi:hypothetical protein
VTGQKFVPRGNNYIRLADQGACGEPRLIYHSTFNPGFYEPTRAEQALTEMRQEGYNVVRVFLNPLCIGEPAGGLSSEYVANVVDFLQKARASDLVVLLTTDDVPKVGGYVQLLDVDCCSLFAGYNVHYLTSGGLEANRKFWRDFIQALKNRQAPLDAIFAYELRNEQFFEANLPPLSLEGGVVTTGNGRTYDMARPEEQQRMMDENLVYWINQLRVGILEADPTALVTIGFFPPRKPNPWGIGDPRVLRTYWAIADPVLGGSSADFIDLHPYPSPWGYVLAKLMENFEVNGFTRKPIIMGEFGAPRSHFSSVADGAQALEDWQVESCKHGFDGWLLWTCDGDENKEFWNASDENRIVNRQLSPRNRPDPCLPGTLLSLTPGPVSATRSLQVTGKLADQSGARIAGAQVEFLVKPLDGPGVYAEYTLSGVVPRDATQGNVGFRVNTECWDCAGISDFALYEVRYIEGRGTNRVPNSNFRSGLEGWGFWGNGTAHLEPSDRGSGRMLHVKATPTQTAAINSAVFSVTPGQTYTLSFFARISPASIGSGYFAIFFLTPSTEAERRKISLEPGIFLSGWTTTDESGAFQFTLSRLPPATLLLVVKYLGDDKHLPAHAEGIIRLRG